MGDPARAMREDTKSSRKRMLSAIALALGVAAARAAKPAFEAWTQAEA